MAQARLGQFSHDPTTGILKKRIDALEGAVVFLLSNLPASEEVTDLLLEIAESRQQEDY